jgi:hypothetical protein
MTNPSLNYAENRAQTPKSRLPKTKIAKAMRIIRARAMASLQIHRFLWRTWVNFFLLQANINVQERTYSQNKSRNTPNAISEAGIYIGLNGLSRVRQIIARNGLKIKITGSLA